ncbi:MAG: hypothetical protein ACK4UV_08835 [Ignavibacterium sp.]
MKIKIKITLFLLAFLGSNIFSLPGFAVKLVDSCVDCHYNLTGGIVRSLYGWYWEKKFAYDF